MRHPLLPALALTLASPALATDYHLYYLGGQSNMDGFGTVSELPADAASPVDRALIFHPQPTRDDTPSPPGIWAPVTPGHGWGFACDGKTNTLAPRFGPELGFARRMAELHPDWHIAIIKYSLGGSSITPDSDDPRQRAPGHWDPDYNLTVNDLTGVNQYDHALHAIASATAIADIDNDGEPDRLIPAGIVWMQGESDATFEANAANYEADLKHLIDLLRAALRVDDLPVAIGRISDSGQDPSDHKVWDFGETVRAAQAAFCDHDPAAALVTTTDGYGHSDPYHYDTAGFLDLGRAFADALESLE
ncbi:MAG: sialate O-acetylesterase [Phycisphaerales bacterium]